MPSFGFARVTIDQCYEEFVAGLPEDLAHGARSLPVRLGLGTRAGIGWGEVFEEPLGAALPTLVLTELERPISVELLASAQRAHLFAMLGALVHERISSGEVEADAELDALLTALERQRHRALAELRLLGADRSSSFATAEREARSAAAAEAEVFEGRRAASLADYVVICSGKHSLAFPATMAAVVAAGAEFEELAQVHDLILGILLGIAYASEVIERSERAANACSWVEVLTRDGDRIATVAELLGLSADAFERAAAAAEALGARPLHAWARGEARRVRALTQSERAA